MWIDLYSSCSTGADFAPRGHLTNFGDIWGCPPGGSAGKESACSVGDLGSIPGLGRSPGEGKGLPTPVFWPGKFHGLYIQSMGSQRVRHNWVTFTSLQLMRVLPLVSRKVQAADAAEHPTMHRTATQQRVNHAVVEKRCSASLLSGPKSSWPWTLAPFTEYMHWVSVLL